MPSYPEGNQDNRESRLRKKVGFLTWTHSHCKVPARNAIAHVNACALRPKYFHATKKASDSTALITINDISM
jgi:hypothetical protein